MDAWFFQAPLTFSPVNGVVPMNQISTFFGLTLESLTFFGVSMEYFGVFQGLLGPFVLISFRSYGGILKCLL
jgi:hypothetical protein